MDPTTDRDILAAPEHFDHYCRQVESAIAERGRARTEFIKVSIDRLRTLLRSAEALGDADLVAELGGHIRGAEGQLAALKSALSGADA